MDQPQPQHPRRPRMLFYMIEINLLLWLATIGGTLQTGSPSGLVGLAIFSGVLAGILQHLAYYRLYRRPD